MNNTRLVLVPTRLLRVNRGILDLLGCVGIAERFLFLSIILHDWLFNPIYSRL